MRQMAGEIVGAELVLRVEALRFADNPPTLSTAANTPRRNRSCPSRLARAAMRISMLPLSSTGI